jgi:hypothetical protein
MIKKKFVITRLSLYLGFAECSQYQTQLSSSASKCVLEMTVFINVNVDNVRARKRAKGC